jgi:hypothetical protein
VIAGRCSVITKSTTVVAIGGNLADAGDGHSREA